MIETYNIKQKIIFLDAVGNNFVLRSKDKIMTQFFDQTPGHLVCDELFCVFKIYRIRKPFKAYIECSECFII